MADSLEHMSDQALSERLLDYVQNRLPADARKAVEAAAAARPAVAEELQFYKSLAAAAKDPDQTPHGGELGWARLSRAIDEEAKPSAPAAVNDNLRWWRYAAVALAFLAVGQGGLLISSQFNAPGDVYVPVSEPASDFAAQIVFAPTATEKEMRELLRAAGGEITSGPSALGVYEIRFSSDEERIAGVKRLREATAIVEDVIAN